MDIIKYPERSEWGRLAERSILDVSALFSTVQEVLSRVQEKGDEALKEYAKLFDNVELDVLAVSDEELEEAQLLVAQELKDAINHAMQNIETFHAAQRLESKKIETATGVTCWQKSIPIEKVGLYIPGGTAPLFSTVLMLAVPARLAGCQEIVLCSPPNAEGKIHPAILYAAKAAGVSKIYKAGGSQAIGAMAYGTQSVPKVYKIFGPGNQYVTAAKQLVSLRDVAIDMPAGPSEVLIIADKNANPHFIASDFLSQAEHGKDSQSILLTDSEELIPCVEEAILLQLDKLPRRDITAQALKNCRIILLKKEDIIDFSNMYAPEHLIIQTQDYADVAAGIKNAGSVFLGAYTPESAGDYASGTNHTLPTNGYAKAYSGVNLDSFIKKVTFQEITADGIKEIGQTIQVMAASEELEAHKYAVTVRLNSL